jgi:molybdopterin biosynthesis enzyme MoaB
MVANLPGNPKAANEILSILLPLLIQGITVWCYKM